MKYTRVHVNWTRKIKIVRIEEFFLLFKTLYYKSWQCFIISVPLLLKSALWLGVWYYWYCWVMGWVSTIHTPHTALNAPRTNNILFHGENIFRSMQSHSIINAIYYIIIFTSTPGSSIRVDGKSQVECCDVEKYHFQNHQKRNPETLS